MADELRVTYDAVYDAMRTLRLAHETLAKTQRLEDIYALRQDLYDVISKDITPAVADYFAIKFGRAYNQEKRAHPDLKPDTVAQRLGVSHTRIYEILTRYKKLEEQP